ncbi:MAG TPA: outer membrane beta-barrel protein [Burkholderiales bacterium]|nr:outer membrane beta-barrel protein [Burkholderiales bacterium]
MSAISCGALAQAPGVQLTMDSGFYLGAGFGGAKVVEGCGGGPCDPKDKTWSVFAGYQFNRHLAVEAAYSDFGEATTSATLAGVPITATIKAKALELVGVGLLPVTDSFSVYAKLGVFHSDADATTSGAVVATSSDKSTGFTIGLGVQYEFVRRFAARFEWQRYNDIGAGITGAEKNDISVWRLAARVKF